MGYEVDFFAVRGSGAAAAVRWGARDRYSVLIYDGGRAESGLQLVEHVRRRYDTDRVDYVVSSHLAQDHTDGLAVVLRKLKVGQLWMHQPRTRVGHSEQELHVDVLARIARSRGIPIHEPFQGSLIGPFTVLSPSRDWYREELLPAFGSRVGPWRSKGRALDHCFRWAAFWAARQLGREFLPRRAITSAEDEASAVLYAEFEGRGMLFSGRAGVRALEGACSYAESMNIRLAQNLKLLVLPDSGNIDNLSGELLDRMVGERLPDGHAEPERTAFISLSERGRPLPHLLAESLRQRGMTAFATEGRHLQHVHDMPERSWRPARPLD
ncbi:conserved hypothetical protein [Burkholderiales bacterium 8X]|nr:conserved hypothetical protein [Burkholderiales bacterium 8X]